MWFTSQSICSPFVEMTDRDLKNKERGKDQKSWENVNMRMRMYKKQSQQKNKFQTYRYTSDEKFASSSLPMFTMLFDFRYLYK